ncbi:3-hydroxyacyl-CoA dehydrogenase type-2 [Dactylonectria macrodidyma]|uniref:3-hydroxyacyl-CoA dehydrogenase type-2 n=1 Tax=Dactylonectria macrodidyma TaxID=307937 RepID=A0A9P9E204_9HYPO|nr:3-hydroxyacyl-CoA dehydrogenase type-2 [Dactylonectria macrodidyma]
MHQLDPSPSLLENIQGQTVIITGSARGIGAATAAVFNQHGANVVIADLPHLGDSAEALIKSLEHPEKAIFISTNIIEWKQMVHLFEETITKFGKVDIVVANAGIMESNMVLDVQLDQEGKPMESTEAIKVLDVNLKGTFNTLRLGLHYLSKNTPSQGGSRGSITLVASTSGYFGTTGNAAYVASKHGVVGLLRSSQQKAKSLSIRVNSVAPCFTPTFITAGFGNSVAEAGIESNTPENVGLAIVYASVDEARRGTCCLVAGKYLRELEDTRRGFMSDWLGQDLTDMLTQFGQFLTNTGGYRLPPSSE